MSPDRAIWFCLAISFLLIQAEGASNITVNNAKEGVFLQKEIPVTEFFPSDSSPSNIAFTASQLGSPDLPPWLQLEQREPTDRAFIYGTPGPEVSSQVVLEITGWNKKDYSTQRRDMIVTIDKSGGVPRYQAEFLVTNRNIDTFLENNESSAFHEKVSKFWKPEGSEVTLVKSALDRDGRVPIPPNKEGVYIAVGGKTTYEVLRKEYQAEAPCGLKKSSKDQLTPPYDIDWCKFSLIDKSKPVTPSPNATQADLAGEGFDESTYVAPVYDSSARDFGSEFILILILPLIIVLIIAIILAIIMFCFREGRPKRDAETARPQLSHHDSILKATFRLRQLSHQNGDPVNDSSSRPQPKDTSTPYKQSSLPTQHDDEQDSPPRGAPPPYRLPPAAGVNVSSPNGDNRYYPGSTPDEGPKRERPPPFMSSGEVH